MVGRLSTYAKNRILALRFQNNHKIKHIAQTLLQEDNIKVSRESISTFLRKYIDTKSIHDKPRSGRNKKLTSEEIQLIGEVTRLNRDITAPKIKQYLNLSVSTHTILRACKLFEWNKHNLNSNEAKKAAALERQLTGAAANAAAAAIAATTDSRQRQKKGSGGSRPISRPVVVATAGATAASTAVVSQLNENQANKQRFLSSTSSSSSSSGVGCGGGGCVSVVIPAAFDDSLDGISDNTAPQTATIAMTMTATTSAATTSCLRSNLDLNLIDAKELANIKKVSSSPMVFASKVLLRLFTTDELIGRNVSGKTFSRVVKHKQALDERRVAYIRWLVEHHFDEVNSGQLWKMCRTSINKTILLTEKKISTAAAAAAVAPIAAEATATTATTTTTTTTTATTITPDVGSLTDTTTSQIKQSTMLFPVTTTIVKLTDDFSADLMDDDDEDDQRDCNNNSDRHHSQLTSRHLKERVQPHQHQHQQQHHQHQHPNQHQQQQQHQQRRLDESNDLRLISEKDILLIKHLYCSPMIFCTKVLTRIFAEDEMRGRNLTGKTFHRSAVAKPALDERRVDYIRWLVEKYFDAKTGRAAALTWKSCRKAMCRVLRNVDKQQRTVSWSSSNDDNEDDNDENEDNEDNAEDDGDDRNDSSSSAAAAAATRAAPEQEHDNSGAVDAVVQRHTIVMLINDPEQTRQILLDQQKDEEEKQDETYSGEAATF